MYFIGMLPLKEKEKIRQLLVQQGEKESDKDKILRFKFPLRLVKAIKS